MGYYWLVPWFCDWCTMITFQILMLGSWGICPDLTIKHAWLMKGPGYLIFTFYHNKIYKRKAKTKQKKHTHICLIQLSNKSDEHIKCNIWNYWHHIKDNIKQSLCLSTFTIKPLSDLSILLILYYRELLTQLV